MTTTAPAESRSIHDFTVTVDTEKSGGDKLVLHLDRDGQPRLTIACGAPQLLWLIDDADHFAVGYRAGLAGNIIAARDGGWSFALLARELGCTEAQAFGLHEQAVQAAKEAAREAAEADKEAQS